MRPQLFNALRHYLAMLLVLLPAFAMAQPQAPEIPCTPASPAPPVVSARIAIPETPAVPVLTMLPEQTNGNCQDAEEAISFDSERRKTFEKTYKVSKSDVLDIQNKFGRVHVNTWNRNEIQVKVDIISRAGSDQAAQELINKISIAESRSGNTIAVRTAMESMKNHGGNKSFEINYTINMPEDNALIVKNSFGDVYLAALKGIVDVNVKYGSLKSDRLGNASNTVSIAYGSGRCGYINGGQVNIAYSSMSLEGTNGIQGSSKFSDFKIGNLAETLDLELKHGSLRVDNISKGVRKINVASGFSPISLNFEDNTAFDFDVNVQFGDFKVDKSLVNYTTLERSHTSAEYRGKFGSLSSKGTVSIVSKYGDVKFTK